MKKIAAIAMVVLFLGCEKTKEKIQEDLVLKAMTDGKWLVSSFTLNGNNITADYATYRFKYYSSRTVDAIKSGTVEKTGTWNGDAATMTISAQFTGAIYPLTLINGSWHITRNSWTYVEASQTDVTTGDVKTMRLDKE